ncbi:class Ib ribonucleoside-diphosphate reductase assembly flavoprotein NrdI [Falsirhodobacter algicola]|uniref:Protein NrdI n=1 Tax=Falsirhodobacter algicola TaxID=2692330 RepID=A0A8J8SK58_9RHOB|nr:class Ib ribonucleoside-diphosphate reductase assembly flavoprotein NrdI [Falsirhodobacter algicola]QUS35171.1 class Ib ribonucleoside-diphosphate reductase assembly flavoprotein NrdI [Falsirhodobacter algicola]
MARLVYYSSGSGNTRRFVDRLGLPAIRIAGEIRVSEPYVLLTPSYSDGEGRGAVAKPVIRFLNDPENRALIRGVIASGNLNFGEHFALAGKIIAAKCKVPLLYSFELAGTDDDVARVKQGLDTFWTRHSTAP